MQIIKQKYACEKVRKSIACYVLTCLLDIRNL